MPTPSSSSSSLQHTLDPHNVWTTPSSCPPESDRAEPSTLLRDPNGRANDVIPSEAGSAMAPQLRTMQNTTSTQQPHPQSQQQRQHTMESDSELSSISAMSGLSPPVPDRGPDRGSGSNMIAEGKDHQDEEDMTPRPLYYARDSITSDKYLSNVRVRRNPLHSQQNVLTRFRPSSSSSPATPPPFSTPAANSPANSNPTAKTTKSKSTSRTSTWQTLSSAATCASKVPPPLPPSPGAQSH